MPITERHTRTYVFCFPPQLSSRTISFDWFVKCSSDDARPGAMTSRRLVESAMLQKMMAANYTSPLSGTDVRRNLVSANRQILKQE